MTTGTASNYGSEFHFPSGTIYPALVVDYPELSMAAVEITNHQGGGVDEFIPSGLLRSGEYTISILGRNGTLSTFKGHETSKTVATCVLKDAIDSLTFSGMITSVKKEPADAKTPDVVKLTITVQPTGGVTAA